jgi:hypothetical protein
VALVTATMISIPMPVMTPVVVTMAMRVMIPVTVAMPVPIPIAAMTVDAKTANYATGDSLAVVFLRPARQRQRTDGQCESANGGK